MRIAGWPSTLHLDVGDDAFIRSVNLTGSSSNRQFASAVSLLNPANMPVGLFSELIAEHVGMGEVLRNSSKGSFRQILTIEQPDKHHMRRTYQVSLEGQPAILITETFTLAYFG